MKTKWATIFLCGLCVLGASLLSGCGTLIANQVVQARHPAIKATALKDGAGIGVDLLNLGAVQSGSDLAIQLGGALVDAATLYGAYRLYERANDSGDSTPALPSQINTGNNSPVQINIGNGSPSQQNPNTTTTGAPIAE